jgi:hypothetical protein
MNYCLKHKIETEDQERTLLIINDIGFENALKIAFDKVLEIMSKNPDAALATKWLSWSYNLSEDARVATDKKEILLFLAKFYRRLAHQVYWHQRSLNQIGYIRDFIQEV